MSEFQFDAFISYAWNKNREAVREFANELREKNIRLWIDVEQMQDDVNQRMIEGIRNSRVFVCCVTVDYANRKNTMRELNYADRLEKEKVFVVFEKFKSDLEMLDQIGKVGFIMGSVLYYNYHTPSKETLNSIVSAIRRVRLSFIHMIFKLVVLKIKSLIYENHLGGCHRSNRRILVTLRRFFFLNCRVNTKKLGSLAKVKGIINVFKIKRR